MTTADDQYRLPATTPAPDLPRAPYSRGDSGPVVRRDHTVGVTAWARLRGFADAAGVTPRAALVAALGEVIRTWSRTGRFALGCVTPGGVRPVAVGGDATFADRLVAVEEQLDAHEGGATRPAPAGPRHTGPAAGTPVTCAVLTGPAASADRADALPVGGVHVAVRQDAGGLLVRWHTRDALFPPGVPEDLADAYGRLLDLLAADPTAWRQRRFALVPQRHLDVVAAVNATDRPLPSALPHELVAANARRHPDRVAVIAADRRLTYGELDRRATRLARTLRRAGAGPGRLVAVVMEKGWEQFVAVYGVLTAGAAYLPIDPAVPADRIAYLLRDGEAGLVLTQSALDRRLRWPASVRRISVDTDTDIDTDATPLDPVQQQSDLAYVISTSGSTGRPKGVMVDNRGLLNAVLDLNRRFGIGPEARSLAVSGLHFDASVFDVFGPLIAGGSVVVPAPADRPDPAHWAELMRRERVTCWLSVPALMEMLVGHLERAGDRGLPTLRLALLGGDWIPLDLPDRLRRLAERVQVVSIGGPTETICVSVVHPIGEVEPAWTSIPYGSPISNQHYYVLDERLSPRPAWVPGQICIGSAVGLARGYWRDPERTRARFRTLPDTGERVYASGDIGRYLPDGTLQILGREDFQVKIQGHRIEPGEIEAALVRHPDVERAAVVAPESDTGARRLVGFVVPPAARTPDHEALRDFLSRTLPAYMVPARLSTVEALPLTANGKVDRLALTEAAGAVDPGGDPGGGPPPRTPAEGTVAALWAEALGLRRIGVHADFFALGGDSLAASRLCGPLYERTGVHITLREFVAGPTVAELAGRLDAAPAAGGRTGGPGDPASPPDADPADATTPLPGQRGMWTAEQMAGGGLYTLVFTAELEGPLDVSRLAGAVDDTLARHDGLRTGFRLGAADLERFVVGPDRGPRPVHVEVPAGAPWPDIVRTTALAHASRPFAFDQGPPLRILLVRGGPRRHALVLVTHHMLVDGWAIGLALREILARYDAAVRGATPELRPAPRPDVVPARLRRLRQRGDLRSQADFWVRRLDGVPTVLDLPSARLRPARQDPAGGRIPLDYGATHSTAVEHRARQLGVTRFACLLAGFGLALARRTGRRRLLVGVPTSRRPATELHDLVAHCTVVVPVLVEVDGDTPVESYLRAVHGSIADSVSNADLPFEEMVRIAGGNGDPRRNPLVQAVFGMYDTLVDWRTTAGRVSVRIEEVHAGGSPMDLTVALQRADPIGGTIEFATAVWGRAEAERFRADLLATTAALAGARGRLADLPSLVDDDAPHNRLRTAPA
ncbi:amino acid adenylation domain-containing protein [Dactylosporangium roseum]|uniref:Amino acid adenylation domain-containing protein n=1 Tax=Dactylosporangium roseum TaxID=47989 RepID=A0ABY5ZFT2_9ACTN|nr:amino acid adenylation domain-containing protein [Dactylosporangium roseum]UWZ39134.1 amino acid adenylation domain-containing protein [Dactylosporangium roseum]